MKKNAGFSLIEAMIFLIVTALLILASFPVLTRKNVFQGKNTSVVDCIQKEDAADLTSPACAATIKGSLYNRNNYFDSLMMYVNASDPVLSDAGLKVLKEICDEGGSLACGQLIDRCVNDTNKCALANNYDLEFYLKLLPNQTNLSTEYIRNTLAGYYNARIANIVAKVDEYCCTNQSYNLACIVKGVTYCSTGGWQKEINKGTDTGNDVAIDSSGNIYVLITTDSKMSIVKLNPNGSRIWDLALSGIDQVSQITYGADGQIYAVGTVTVTATNTDIAVVKINSAIGVVEWARRYGDNQSIKDFGMGITTDSNYVYIVGYSASKVRTGLNDLRLLKINSFDGDIATGTVDTSTVDLYRQFVTNYPTDPDYSDHKGTAIELVNGSLYFVETYGATSCPDGHHVLIGKASTLNLTPGASEGVMSNLHGITVTGMTKGIDPVTTHTNLYVTANNDTTPNGILVIYDTSTNKIIRICRYTIAGKFNNVAAVDNSSLVYVVGTYGKSVILICIDTSDGTVKWKRRINTTTGDGNLTLQGQSIVATPYGTPSVSQYSFTVASYTDTNNVFALKLPLTLNNDTSFTISNVTLQDLNDVTPYTNIFKELSPVPVPDASPTNVNNNAAVNYSVSSPTQALLYN